MATISAILLAFDDKKYELKQSLLSVYSQERQPDEIIIIESSASEENKWFIKDILHGNEKYLFVNKQSNGEELSDFDYFEIGAKNSTQEYLAFIKAGDVWTADKIQIVNETLEKSKTDLLVHSFLQRVCFNDEKILMEHMLESSCFAIFFAAYAFSAAIIKKIVFFALEDFSSKELESLQTFTINDVLGVHTSNAQKDLLRIEGAFWKDNYAWFKKNNLLQQAALFCIKVFQKAEPSQCSYLAFAKNVGLASEDSIQVLFGQEGFSKKGNAENINSDKVVAERRQKQYIFVRNWLEFKIAGGKISDRLKALNVTKIAIYGAGKHGSILFNELQGSDIEISFWIDSSPKALTYLGVPVVNMLGAQEKVDAVNAVIVTPFLEYDGIADALKQAGFKNIISIADIAK